MPDKILDKKYHAQLDTNIRSMLDAGLGQEDIDKMVSEYTNKFGREVGPVPAQKKDLLTFQNPLETLQKQSINNPVERDTKLKEAVAKDKEKSGNYFGAMYDSFISAFDPLKYIGEEALIGSYEYLSGKKISPQVKQAMHGTIRGVMEAQPGAVKKTQPEQYTEGIQAGWDMSDGFGMKDMKALGLMGSRVAGDITVAAAGTAAGLPAGSTYFVQGYGDGLKDFNDMATKNNIEPNQVAKQGYALTVGAVNSLLEQYGFDKIFGKGLVFKKIQKEVVSDLFKQTAKTSGKIAFETIEKEADNIIRKKLSSLSNKGLKTLYGAGVEAVTEAGQTAAEEGSKLLANIVQGEQVFDEEDLKKNFWKNIYNAAAGGAALGAPMGFISTFTSNVDNTIRKEVANAKTPEELAQITSQLQDVMVQNGASEEEVNLMVGNVKRYNDIKQTLPKNATPEVVDKSIELIDRRISIDDQINKKNAELETIDESLRSEVESEIGLLEDTKDYINDSIKESVTGEKFTYTEDKGKYYKKFGEQEPQPISKNRYELQQLKQQEDATTTSEGQVQEGGAGSDIGQRKGTENVKAQETPKTDIGYRYIVGEEGAEVPVAALVNKKVRVNGQPAILYQEGQRIVARVIGTNKILDTFGSVTQMMDALPQDFGIEVDDTIVSENPRGGYKIDGEDMVNDNENPLDAISVDSNGNVMNVVLKTQAGKRRKYRGQVAQDLAYQITLKETLKNEDEFEAFLEQEHQAELDAAEAKAAAEAETARNNEPVPEPKQPVGSTTTTTPAIGKFTADNINDIDKVKGNRLQKKIIGDIKRVLNALKELVPITVNLHNQDSFTEVMKETGDNEEAALLTRGFYMGSDGSIHLNMDLLASDTMLHEGFHPILDYLAANNPEVINELFGQLESIPEAAQIISDAKENYDGDVTQKKEAITDFVAGVADGRVKLNPSNFQKIKNFILDMLNKIGIGQGGSTLMNVNNEQDLIKLANYVTEKFTKGEEITAKGLEGDVSEEEQMANIEDDLVGEKQYDSSEGQNIDKTIPEKGSGRGPQFSKSTLKNAKNNIKKISDLVGLKISRVVFYDMTRVGKLDIKNTKTGYTPDVDGKGGPMYSYMDDSINNKSVLAFVSITQAIQSLQRQQMFPDAAHAVASQNPLTAHLGNMSTLNALFGEGIGIFQKAAKTKAQEKEIVGVLVSEIDRMSNMAEGSEAKKSVDKILSKVDLSSIKTINDFRDKILLGEGHSFGKRGSILTELLQNKQSKVTAATRQSHKILHYKYGIPTLEDIAKGNNQTELSNVELGDVVKFVRPSTEPVIYTTDPAMYDLYSKKPTPAMKEAGIRIELLPETSAHESYPFILAGENVALLQEYIGAQQLYKNFPDLKKSATFFKLGRMKKEAEAGVVAAKTPTEKKGPDFQRVAPNGKPSKLNAKQYEQVRTPEFKAWFGDWENDPANASKVVDENGEPLVVYHGTKGDFDVFKVNKDVVANAVFFTSNENYAKEFPRKQNKDGSKVMSLFIDIKSPISEDDFFSIGNNGQERTEESIKIGKDGMITEDGVFLVFNPNQIKSASANVGTFSTTDNRIQFQRGDKLTLRHGGETKIVKFDESKIKGGARGELGYGYYFSEDTKYKDYGKEVTSIDASSLNIVGENDIVPKDFTDKITKWQSKIPETSFGIGMKEIAGDYIDRVKKEINSNPSISFQDLRRNVNTQFSVDREPMWSSMMSGIGIDGLAAMQGDGTGRSTIRQAVLYPNEKLNSLIINETQFQKATPTKSNKGVVSTFIQKNFTTSGLLGREVLKFKEQMGGEISAEMDKAERYSKKAMDLIKKYSSIVSQKQIEDVLSGVNMQTQLPMDLIDALQDMRSHIDNLTQRMIDLGIITSQDSIDLYNNNKGQYMLRSYELYNTKATYFERLLLGKAKTRIDIDNVTKKLENVDQAVVDRALQYLANQALAQNPLLTIAEAKEKARARANAILADTDTGFSGKGMDGSVNVESLQKRQQLAPEIRALMGEYTDPVYRYYSSIFKLAGLTANRSYLNKLKEEGLNKFLFTSKTRDASVQIAGKESDALEPLNGLWTFPEIKEALQMHEPMVRSLFQTFAGTIRKFKTVYNPGTHVKNILGNMGFFISNGHWMYAGESWDYVRDIIKGNDSKKLVELVDVLNRNGVLNSSVGINELKSYFDRYQNVDDYLASINNASSKSQKGIVKKTTEALNKIPKGAQKLYEKEDDIFKILAFVNESNRYSKAIYGKDYSKLTDAERKDIISQTTEIVKNTYPTFSRVPKFVRGISKIMFLGNFLSFPVESVRVSLETLKLAMKEIKSGNDKLMNIGITRLAGTVAYNSLFTWFTTYFSMVAATGAGGMIGAFIDDEDEKKRREDTRMYRAQWNKNSEVINLKFSDGIYNYMDIGSLDSYNYQRQVWNAFWENINKPQDVPKAALKAAARTIDPYLEFDMTYQTFLSLYNNEDDFGKKIYNPALGYSDRLIKQGEFAAKKFSPGAIAAAMKVYKSYDESDYNSVTSEIRSQFFARPYSVDLRKQFASYMYAETDKKNTEDVGFKQMLENAKDIYTSVKYKTSASKEEKEYAYNLAIEKYKSVLERISKYYHAAVAGGVPAEDLTTIMMRARLKTHEINGIKENKYNAVNSAYIRK